MTLVEIKLHQYQIFLLIDLRTRSKHETSWFLFESNKYEIYIAVKDCGL